jgi:hypothetical protein
LTGIDTLPPAWPQTFSHELIVHPSCAHLLPPEVLSVEPVSTSTHSASEPLRYRVRFAPERMVRGTAELILRNAAGAVWPCELRMEAQQPAVESALTLEAHADRTVEVPIYLYSDGVEPMPFRAEFEAGSSLQFNVRPVEGFLPPPPGPSDERPPPALYLTFHCRDPLRVLKATLAVRVPGMSYIMRLDGHIPGYQKPHADLTLVDDHLAPAVSRELARALAPAKTNHVVRNIKAAMGQPPGGPGQPPALPPPRK